MSDTRWVTASVVAAAAGIVAVCYAASAESPTPINVSVSPSVSLPGMTVTIKGSTGIDTTAAPQVKLSVTVPPADGKAALPVTVMIPATKDGDFGTSFSHTNAIGKYTITATSPGGGRSLRRSRRLAGTGRGLRERHLGADHPNTLNARYNLAYYLQALGRFTEAVRIAEDVVARQRRVIGERHPRLAPTLRLLARALDSAGRAEDALSPIAEALSIHAERFGLVHFEAASDRVWQAQIEAHTGRLADAERDAREALSFFDTHAAAVRADVPSMRACLGGVLAEAGRLEDAEAQIARAVSDLRTAHQDGPFLGLALDALGDVARRRQQMPRAVELTREALAVLERDLGVDHPATSVARVHAGAAQWSQGQTVSAESLMRAGLDQLARQFPAGHPDLAGAQFLFGQALQENGRSVEARPFLQSAFNWRRTHFGEKDPRTIAGRHALDASKH